MSSYFKQTGRNRDSRAILKEIVKRIQKLESKTDAIDTFEFTQTIRSNNDRIAYVTGGKIEGNAVVVDPNLKDFQLPLEPDGDKLTCWMRMDSVGAGNIITDSSGYGNNALVVGTIIRQNGPVEDLPGRQFDTTEGGDKLRITDSPSINTFTQTLTTGFSINFNINPTLVTADGGTSRVIACKVDDSVTTREYAWIIWIDTNSNLYFQVRTAGVIKTTSKTSAFPSLNSWYRVICTYSKATSTPKIYINGALANESISNFSGDVVLPTSTTDLIVGGTDSTSSSRLAAIVSDFRYWREYIISQTEAENIQANGYTITGINYPFIVGRSTLISNEIWDAGPGGNPGDPPPNPDPTPGPVYTLTSFDQNAFSSDAFA